jgi:hypothetical protein
MVLPKAFKPTGLSLPNLDIAPNVAGLISLGTGSNAMLGGNVHHSLPRRTVGDEPGIF